MHTEFKYRIPKVKKKPVKAKPLAKRRTIVYSPNLPPSTTKRGVTLIEIFEQTTYIKNSYIPLLYKLLMEREEHECISHRRMPTYEQHVHFFRSQPYQAWFMIRSNKTNKLVGTVYITDHNEIGIQIFKACRGKNYARETLSKIVAQYCTRRLLANINPKNEASIALFAEFGFTHIQNTYEFGR